MKTISALILALSLGACAAPHFVADAPAVQTRAQPPERFELPARFAITRVVYGQIQGAGDEELVVWEDLARRYQSLGTFSAFAGNGRPDPNTLSEIARVQRFNYLLVVTMHPETSTSDIALYDTASGGLMVTAQSASSQRGERGFWGGRIKNPNRLERVTLGIARDASVQVEAMLQGVSARQD